MKEILDDFRANKSSVSYPEAVKQNVHAQAFYGVILPIINEVADFDINLIGEVALDIADIIERCTKVDWENYLFRTMNSLRLRLLLRFYMVVMLTGT